MSSQIIQEFIQALDEEIDAIKKGKGGSTVKVFNGRFLRDLGGLSIYVFNLENFLAVLDEVPAEIEFDGSRYQAQILMTQGLEVEIGIERYCGQFIGEAKLYTNLWYLLELLKKKYSECSDGSTKVNFQLSDTLFSSQQAESGWHQKSEPRYSIAKEVPNEAQKRAISACFHSRLCVIWGPPGTGKTTTIAQAIEAHLNAGRRVLLVSHANNAVDGALEKVAVHLKPSSLYQEGKLVRLGKPQEEYLKRLETNCELVLMDRIAEKLGESLSREKKDIQKEKMAIEDALAQFATVSQAVSLWRRLTSEKDGLHQELARTKKQLGDVNTDLAELGAMLNDKKSAFGKARSAGTLRKLLFGLHPEKIQRDIDRTTVSIDAKRRQEREFADRLNGLNTSIQEKELQAARYRSEVNSVLEQLNVTESELETRIKWLDRQRDEILSRIAEINSQLEEIQGKILSDAQLIATTLTQTFVAKVFPDTTFDVLILDEASMAPLPHVYWAASKCKESVTIVGDFLQLPPICIAEKRIMAQKWLGRSIFDVLGMNGVDEAMKDSRVTMLDTQYRMNPEISAISNRFFYRNLLNDDPSTADHRLADQVSQSSLVLVDTSATNPWCSRLSAGSRFNLYNALVSATLARRIIKEGSGINVGIITPYAAQARLINKIMKDWQLLDHVRTGTIHRFQGGETSVVVFDTCEGSGVKVAPMLDDKVDPSARLVLNVAMTRAKNRLYVVGHLNHLLSSLHRESSLARIIRHLHSNGETLSSDSLVDNYFATDFERWAKELLVASEPGRPPSTGELFTEKNFWVQFLKDITEVKERLVILSPFVSVRRAGLLIDYFKVMRARGVDLQVFTRPIAQQTGEMATQADVVIGQFRDMGAKVTERQGMHQKVALLDNRIAWEGSLNILSHRDSGEQMRRLEGESAIEEIVRCLDLDKETVVGNITSEKCPRCGMPMVVRKSKYGQFLSCSRYPECDGKVDYRRTQTARGKKSCPDCGKPMVVRKGKKGAFLGCSGYPVCKKTMPL